MNAKDKKEIAEIVMSIITAKKQETTQKPAQKPTEKKNEVPPHKKADIPALLKEITKQESVVLFGNILERPPYQLDISKFYNAYNIQLETNSKGYKESKSLTLEQKHGIILTQLKGSSKKVFNSEKQRHIEHLKQKIANPPEFNMFHRQLTDKNIENINANLQKEIARWEIA